MQNISQIFTSEKFEEQYQKYVNKYRFEFQAKQRMLLTPLLLFYIVAKIQEKNWFALGLNLILLIAILFTLKYEGILLRAYNILIVSALILFNLFYAVSFYMQVTSERYQYIDGYFVAILSLGVMNQLETIQKVMILLLFYIFLIVLTSNPGESLWSQILKFLSYIFLYCQSQYYDEKLLRSTYIEYRKHLKIEKNLLKNQDIKCFVTYFNKQKQSIMIESNCKTLHDQEVYQQSFSEFTRKINIICKKPNSHSMAVSTQSDKINLEQFLFYYFTDPKKTQVISPHCDDKNPYLHGISKSEHYQIRIVKCYDITPKAILFITEHQKELQQQKLKLQKKQMYQLLNYFEDIFLKQIRVSLIALKGANSNIDEFRKNKLKFHQLINFLQGKLYIAQNSFYNISDFLFPNADYNKTSIIQLDLIKVVHEALTYVKYNNGWNSKASVKFDEKTLQILSDQKLVKQLFINLIQFSAQYSNELEISLQEDQDLSLSPQQIVNIKFLLTCPEDNVIFLKNHPIINPQTIEELKKNCSTELELNLPISLMIIRNLGPFDKITFRNISRNQYKLQFYLYKHLDFKSKLIPLMSFDPKYYITKKENWQLTEFQQRQISTGIYGSSPRIRIDTCRASHNMREQFFSE